MITKQGQLISGIVSEVFSSLYDREFYEEPDGSLWVRVMHHNAPASNLFSSSDKFTENVYKSANVWFVCNLFSSMDKWEIMVKQALTSGGTVYKYRWVQGKNPMTAVYADVASGSITKNTTTGYTSTSFGGLYKHNSNTYLCANNGTNGNWWGSVGAWANHQGGIPAWNGQVVTTGYMDLYARVDNVESVKLMLGNDITMASALIEY